MIARVIETAALATLVGLCFGSLIAAVLIACSMPCPLSAFDVFSAWLLALLRIVIDEIVGPAV